MSKLLSYFHSFQILLESWEYSPQLEYLVLWKLVVKNCGPLKNKHFALQFVEAEMNYREMAKGEHLIGENILIIINYHWEIMRILYHKTMFTFEVSKIPEGRNTLWTSYMQKWQI